MAGSSKYSPTSISSQPVSSLTFFRSSVTEAFTQGIPLIIWPVGAEQTVNAAMLSAELNPVAIELLQVLAFPNFLFESTHLT
jgi:hypothetical protein